MLSTFRPLLRRTFALALACALAAPTFAPTSTQAQTLRDRLQDRMAERQANRGGSQDRSAYEAGEEITISVGGLNRTYVAYAPANMVARPGVVMVLHGGSGTARGIMGSVRMNPVADQQGFLAIYPQAAGEGARWNSGTAISAGGPDDIAFLRAVIADVAQRYNADPSRVYAGGISSGGSMLYALACQAPGMVRAIAPVAANMSQEQQAACNPSQGTPIMMFSGTDDPLMVYNGGPAELQIGQRGNDNAGSHTLVGAPRTIEFWAARNGCGAPSETAVADVANDDTTVTQITYACGSNQTYMFRINNGGHSWPGGATERRITGHTSEDISASATMVQFFRNYGL